MSFETELLEALGDSSATFDIRASVRRCFFYDFEDAPTRLWDGVGILNAGGHEWIGTIDENGDNLHTAPAVSDSRDGSSPRYTFGIPRISAEMSEALKAEEDAAKGRSLTCYHVVIKHGEGLRPGTALRFAYQLRMQEVNFSDSVENGPANPKIIHSVAVLARTGEVGRSRTPSGTMTDTSQRERARLLGLPSDSFCSFVASNSNRTLTIEGT